MSRLPKYSLQKGLMRATYRTLVAFLLIIALTLLLSYEGVTAGNRENLATAAAHLDSALSLHHAALSSVSHMLSYNKTLTSLYTGAAQPGGSVMNGIYDIVELTMACSDIVQDMAVVTRRGSVRSFFSSLSVDCIDRIRADDLYDFGSDDTADTLTYLFFEDRPSPHDPMFTCLFPLLDTDAKTGTFRRLGTIVLACRVSALQELLPGSLPQPYACTLTADNGVTAAAYQSPEYQEKHAAFHCTRRASDLPLTITVGAYRSYRAGLPALSLMLVLLMVLLIAAVIHDFSRTLRRSLVKPVNAIAAALPAITLNSEPLPETGVAELDAIVGSINHMLSQLEGASRERVEMTTRLLETELRNNQAELYALQSQIHPHFLFNTLQCVRSLSILGRNDDAAKVCSALSAMLRYSIRRMEMSTIGEEAAIVDQYLTIVDIRNSHRYRFNVDIAPEILGCRCPCMILQPLVENAVVHGLDEGNGSGEVRIRGWSEDGLIRFEVLDDGAGIPEEQLAALRAMLRQNLLDLLEHPDRYGSSIGLMNIQRRIQLQYGPEYGLEISVAEGWTKAALCFPAGEAAGDGGGPKPSREIVA